MSGLVDDTVLGSIVLRGTPAEVGAQLVARYRGTAERANITVPHAIDAADLAELAAAVAAG
jgi:hypothetical protein